MTIIKKFVREFLANRGLRIVPRERDADFFWKSLDKLQPDIVLDVGANNGVTSEGWLRKFPLCHVHSFEALDMYRSALDSVAAKYPGRMTVWPYAASDECGTTEFLLHEDHPSSSSLLPATATCKESMPFTAQESKQTVQVNRIDNLLSSLVEDQCHDIFVKLDVQGAELKVLNGCSALLNQINVVIIEVNLMPLYENQPSFLDIAKFLEINGLQFGGVLEQFHLDQGKPVYLDAVFLRQ